MRSDGQCTVQVSDLALIYNYFVETLAKPEKSRLRIECVECPDCESSDCKSNQDCESSAPEDTETAVECAGFVENFDKKAAVEKHKFVKVKFKTA